MAVIPEVQGSIIAHVGSVGGWNPGRYVREVRQVADSTRRGKGREDRVYPLTPDFAEFLRAVPSIDRTGKVLNPVLHRGVCHRIDSA